MYQILKLKLHTIRYRMSYLCYLYKYTTFFRFCNRQNVQSFEDFLYKITKKIPPPRILSAEGGGISSNCNPKYWGGEVYHQIATQNIGER